MAPDVEAGAPFALYPLRVGLALVFLFTGSEKLLDVEGNAVIVAFTGIPWPEATTVLVGIAEVLGALAILLGVLARSAAAGLSLLMLAVLFTLKIPGPFWGDGWGIDTAILAGTLTILLNGPGRPTLWRIIGRAPSLASLRAGLRRMTARKGPVS